MIGCGSAMSVIPAVFCRSRIVVMIAMVVICLWLHLHSVSGFGMVRSGMSVGNGRDDQRHDHEEPNEPLHLPPEHGPSPNG
jgi:hypothetical protein